MDAQEHARTVRQLVHEFNNQLFVIGGHCELLSLQLEPGSRAHADLAAILEAAERMFGWTAADIVGGHVGRLMPRPENTRREDHLSPYLAVGGPALARAR